MNTKSKKKKGGGNANLKLLFFTISDLNIQIPANIISLSILFNPS